MRRLQDAASRGRRTALSRSSRFRSPVGAALATRAAAAIRRLPWRKLVPFR